MIQIEIVLELHQICDEPVLRQLVLNAGFKQSPETGWAYDKVRSFLKDGWTSISAYTRRQRYLEEGGIEIDAVGWIINKIVGGYRVGTVGRGTYPTPLDMAAFVFWETVEPPLHAEV